MTDKKPSHATQPAPPDGTGAVKVAWHPVTAIVIVVLLFLVAQFAAAIVVELVLPGRGTIARHISGNVQQFLYVAVAEALSLGGLWLVLRSKKQGRQFIGLVQPKWWDILYAIIGYGVYFMLYIVVLTVLSHLIPALNIDQKQDTGFNPAAGPGFLLIFIPLAILAPLTEEALVRGFLFKNLRMRMGFWWATLIASVLFGLAHLGGGEAGSGALWIAAVDTFSLSIVLCYLRDRTGRLWASIGLHAIKNSIAFVFLFLLAK